jgi:peroxiredoxin
MKSLSIILAFVLLTVIKTSAQTPAPTVPSFSFRKLDKKEFTSKDLEPGKFLFFVFFDTQCDHCQRSIQYISQHYSQFNKTAIYLITLDSAEKIKPFMNKYGISLKDKKNVMILQDTRNEFIQKFRPRKYPSLFLYSSRKELMLYEDNEQNLFRFIQKINTSAK